MAMTLPRLCRDRPARDNNFDFLRFFFACLVIFSHSFSIVYGNYIHEPLFAVSGGFLSFGAIAVMGFFVISGYLITQSWQRSGTAGDYLKKRVLRIYPGFIAASLFCLLIVGPLGADSFAAYRHHVHPVSFLLRMALLFQPRLPGVFAHNPQPGAVDASMWTIRYEFLCYLLVAAFGLLGLWRRRVVLGLFVLCLSGNLWLFGHRHVAYTLPEAEQAMSTVAHALSFFRLDLSSAVFGCLYFLAGAVYFLYRDRIVRSPALALLALCLVLVSFTHPVLLIFTMPLCGPYLLFLFAFHAPFDLRAFAARGDFSYGMYLYAFPLQQLLVSWGSGRWHPVTLFIAVLPLALLG